MKGDLQKDLRKRSQQKLSSDTATSSLLGIDNKLVALYTILEGFYFNIHIDHKYMTLETTFCIAKFF